MRAKKRGGFTIYSIDAARLSLIKMLIEEFLTGEEVKRK